MDFFPLPRRQMNVAHAYGAEYAHRFTKAYSTRKERCTIGTLGRIVEQLDLDTLPEGREGGVAKKGMDRDGQCIRGQCIMDGQ